LCASSLEKPGQQVEIGNVMIQSAPTSKAKGKLNMDIYSGFERIIFDQ
jgi:hypothetical protein